MPIIKMIKTVDSVRDAMWEIYIDDKRIDSSFSEEVANKKYEGIKERFSTSAPDPIIVKEERI